jgi:hypothetical protein
MDATLESIETPVLIAWCRRCVVEASTVVAAATSRVNPARDAEGHILYHVSDSLWAAERQIEHAVSGLCALERDNGTPVTVRVNPADFGTDTFTFSRDQKANDTIYAAAKAIAFATCAAGTISSATEAIETRMHASLTGNFGKELDAPDAD